MWLVCDEAQEARTEKQTEEHIMCDDDDRRDEDDEAEDWKRVEEMEQEVIDDGGDPNDLYSY